MLAFLTKQWHNSYYISERVTNLLHTRVAPKNYIPVALISHLIKVFERVLRRALVRHIESNTILPEGQHGSRALRSTLTQLLSHWDTILDGLEQGSGVDCIYLDFSKAFDKVETGVLLHNLRDAKILPFWIPGTGSRQ